MKIKKQTSQKGVTMIEKESIVLQKYCNSTVIIIIKIITEIKMMIIIIIRIITETTMIIIIRIIITEIIIRI